LIIDANAVLTSPIALQHFQSVSGRDAQVLQATGNFQLSQLPARYACYRHKPPHWLPAGESCRIAASEGNNHQIVTRRVMIFYVAVWNAVALE
jgi:hypothetical protein